MVFQKLCKPFVGKVTSESVQLSWDEYDKKADFYQVRYKIREPAAHKTTEKWRLFASEILDTRVTVNGLKTKTYYIFQVRVVKDGQELPYSDSTDPVETRESLASRLLEFSATIDDCFPRKVKPPLHEDPKARNSKARTKQLQVGKYNFFCGCRRLITKNYVACTYIYCF